MSIRKLSVVVCAVFMITIGVASLLTMTSSDSDQAKIRVEAVKYLIQLGVVVIIGGIIATLFKLVERSREVAQKEREEKSRRIHLRADIHESYLKNLGNIYRSVKSSRRILRAAGLTNKWVEPDSLDPHQIEVYKVEMEKINIAQLELEGMMIESERLPVFIEVAPLAEDLHTMENYLRKILQECEENLPRLKKGEEIPFRILKKLREFTGSTADSFPGHRFIDSFWEPCDAVLRNLSSVLIQNAANKALDTNSLPAPRTERHGEPED